MLFAKPPIIVAAMGAEEQVASYSLPALIGNTA